MRTMVRTFFKKIPKMWYMTELSEITFFLRLLWCFFLYCADSLLTAMDPVAALQDDC